MLWWVSKATFDISMWKLILGESYYISSIHGYPWIYPAGYVLRASGINSITVYILYRYICIYFVILYRNIIEILLTQRMGANNKHS